MAAPMQVHSNFCNSLFSLLKKSPAVNQGSTECILAVLDGSLLVWDNFNSVLRVSTCNLLTKQDTSQQQSSVQQQHSTASENNVIGANDSPRQKQQQEVIQVVLLLKITC